MVVARLQTKVERDPAINAHLLEQIGAQLRGQKFIGLTLIILPTVAWLTWGLWGYLLEGVRTGERTGSGGWNPVVWPFRVVLVLGFAMFTIQIFAEILKRIAAISGKPIDTSANADHGV